MNSAGELRVAVIPVGGEAVRLWPLTVSTSKALIHILNRPILEFIILELAVSGIEEVYLGARGYHNYRDVYDYFREGFWLRTKYPFLDHDVRVRYMPRYETLGNADAVRVILEYYDIREPFVVVQCDDLFKLDLAKAYEFHRASEADMTICLKEVTDVAGFGVAELDSGCRIRRFVEKPRPEEAPSNLANTGIYIVEPSIRGFFEGREGMEMLKLGRMDFGKDIIPRFIELGYRVFGFVAREGYWFDIGTPERYLEAVMFLLRNAVHQVLDAEEKLPGVFMQGKLAKSRALHEDIINRTRKSLIRFSGVSLLGRHVKIGNDVSIHNSVIENYTVIESGCSIANSVIMDRTYIEKDVVVESSIVGRHSYIEGGAVVLKSYLGDNAHVGARSRLINVKVWPHEKVPPHVHVENYEIKTKTYG